MLIFTEVEEEYTEYWCPRDNKWVMCSGTDDCDHSTTRRIPHTVKHVTSDLLTANERNAELHEFTKNLPNSLVPSS